MEAEQCLDVGNPETSENQGQCTIDDQHSSEKEEDLGSKETEQCLGVVSPETSGNQLGQVTIDDPSSGDQEDSGSKETEQCLGVFSPESSGNEGQVTIDNPSSEQEDSGSKETEQCLGVVSVDTSGNQGQVTMDHPMPGNIEVSDSKDTEECSGVVNPETSGNQGQVTIDNSSSGNSESSIAGEHMVSYEFLEFPYKHLVTATGNFSDRISEGYYGSIYRGTLSDLSQEVAVKLLNNVVTEFSNDDIAKLAHDIGRASHPNIVKFVGYCNEQLDRHILVYEFIPTTLSSYLHDSPHMPPLDWATRMEIAYGVAKGLDYLHNTMRPRVIYRKISSSNILLNGDFRPKLAGFGIGQLRHTGYCKAIHAVGRVEVSAICDIHGFGVVFLELLTGQKAYDETRGSSPWLADWVLGKVVRMEPKGIQDPALKGKVKNSTFGKALRFAVMFCQKSFKLSCADKVLPLMDCLMGQKVDDSTLGRHFSQNFESEAAEEEEGKTTNKKKNKKKEKKN